MRKKSSIEDIFLSEITRFKNKTLLACVSGGVDSMVMLFLLDKFSKNLNIAFSVLTVNHRIRSDKETQKDISIIQNFCDTHSIPLYIHDLGKSALKNCAKERKKGTEEAARFLRYHSFAEYAEKTHSDAIFLAHNQDDNLETIIQRFLQGSFGKSSSGILKERELFFRPLLSVSKDEIKEYAFKKKITFHEDSTNTDEKILRNSIRLNIIPLLNEKFPGWKTGLLHGAHKNELAFDLIDNLSEKIKWNKCQKGLETDADIFESQHISVRLTSLKKALDLLHPAERISNENLEKFALSLKPFSASSFRFFKEKNFIKIVEEVRTKSSFFVIIDKNKKDSLFCFYSDEEKDL